MKLAVLAAAAAVASATLGVDVSQPTSVEAAKCLKAQGRTFAIVRGYCSPGELDPNAPASIANFWAAGFAHVDTYLFPCRAKSATAQVDALVANLHSHGTRVGQIWLDIETNPSSGCGWGVAEEESKLSLPKALRGTNATAEAIKTDEAILSANCDYIGQLVAAIRAAGYVPGVYASTYMWSSIAGSGCTSGSSAALWYAHYDGSASFGDYSPFGGWAHPAMKQYADSGPSCGVGVDSNFYP